MDTVTGFKPLKEGRIHFQCPICGRKQSNMKRSEDDPIEAVVAVFGCPKHDDTGSDIYYFSGDGKEVEWSPFAPPTTHAPVTTEEVDQKGGEDEIPIKEIVDEAMKIIHMRESE